MRRKTETISDIMQSVRFKAELAAEKLGCPKDLAGMCAAASHELYTRLKEFGIDCRIAVNDSHVFVLYWTSVLDVTATQFGHGKLCLAKAGSKEYWCADYMFDNEEEYLRYMENHPAFMDIPHRL